MDALSVAGNTTVVNGSGSERGSYTDEPSTSSGKKIAFAETTGISAQRRTHPDPFMKTTDYLEEDKPFFVKVGKDGVLPALQKLNDLLVAVRADLRRCLQASICD